MKRIYVLWICILNINDPFAVLVFVLVLKPQVLDNNTEYSSMQLGLYAWKYSSNIYLTDASECIWWLQGRHGKWIV